MSIHEDVERRARERVGTVLRGKYQLDALLGIGGMGAVYAATHKNNRSRVAVKVLHSEQSINSQIRQRFLREGYVANTVDHVGAVRVIDDDTAEDGSVFLVMELLEGETLEARLRRRGGKLPESEVGEIAVHLLDVLAAAHSKKIVHRDLKPENIFITNAQVVKVLDFGIARLREDGAALATQTGQTVGTPAFMSPEQALGETDEIGPETDVWAVGATIFTALSGELVHDEAQTAMQMVVRAATKKARSLATVAPEASPALVAIVDRALSFDRKDRYRDAGEMRDAMRDSLGIKIVSGPHLPRISAPEIVVSSNATPDDALAPTLALPEDFGAERRSPRSSSAREKIVVGSTTAGLSTARVRPRPPSRPHWITPVAVLGVVAVGAVGFFAFRKSAAPVPPAAPVVAASPASAVPSVTTVIAPLTPAVEPSKSQDAPARSAPRPSSRPVATHAPSASASVRKVDPLDRQ